MNRVNRNYWLAAVLMIALGVMPAGVSAQSKRDVEQTYVLNQPYETVKLKTPKGKKVKNPQTGIMINLPGPLWMWLKRPTVRREW